MSEDITPPVGDTTEETNTDTVTEPKVQEITIPKSRFDEVNSERKALKAQLEDIEKKQAEEQGNYKELASKYETELTQLKDSYKQANVKVAVTEEASSHNPYNVEAVMKFIEIDKIVDETGEVKTDMLSAEFTRIHTEMPYLFKDPKIQNSGNPSGGNPENTNTPIFRESQLQDSDFVAKNIKAITEAKKEGKILIGQ